MPLLTPRHMTQFTADQVAVATARVETLTVTLSGGVLARGEVVTVTVIDSPRPGTGADVSESACDGTQKVE